MRQILADAAVLFVVALGYLAVNDSFATDKGAREQRRATEIMFESCVDSCRQGCAKVPK